MIVLLWSGGVGAWEYTRRMFSIANDDHKFSNVFHLSR